MIAILHCAKHWGIGRNNELLFRLPKDMAFFRATTTGKTVIMGDRTLLSLPGGRPLKNRETIVMSIDPEFAAEGAAVCHSVDELAALLADRDPDSVFVCGGAAIYRLLLPYCSAVLITIVDAEPECDRYFPNLDADERWTLSERSDAVEDNGYTIRFCKYVNSCPEPLPTDR